MGVHDSPLVPAIAAALALALPHEARSQAPALGGLLGCRAVLAERDAGLAQRAGDGACRVLADELVTQLATPAVVRAMAPRQEVSVSPRDLQSRASGDAGGAGAAQSEAVPTIQPTALASGSLAAVGAGRGSATVAAFSLNPALLLGSDKDPNQQAQWSRLMDLTILTPVDAGGDADSARVEYLGLRLRVNVVSLRARQRLEAARDAFTATVEASDVLADRVEERLLSAPNVDRCVAAYQRVPVDSTAARATCGGYVAITPATEEVARFRERLIASREEIDKAYFGLDIRYDVGDASIGEIPGFKARMLAAGVAFGRQVRESPAGVSLGIRGRIGIQHVEVDSGSVVDSTFVKKVFDAAIAFEMTRPYEFRPLRLMGGFEFRRGPSVGTALDDAIRSRSAFLRLSLDVPISPSHDITIAYASPVSGSGAPRLSVNFNWQMLQPLLTPAP